MLFPFALVELPRLGRPRRVYVVGALLRLTLGGLPFLIKFLLGLRKKHSLLAPLPPLLENRALLSQLLRDVLL